MKKLFLITTLAASAASLTAGEAIFQASLTPDIAIYTRASQINGLSLGFWGENPQHALAISLFNGSTGDSQGVTLGIVNYADSYEGIAFGWLNSSRENFYGWQNGVINFSHGTFTGLQMGALNVTQEMHGLQLGVFNYSENLRGVQLGFLNVALTNPVFKEMPDKLAPIFPFVNWSF